MQRRERCLEGKRVLVTGGTGSLGKVFVRRVLSGEMGTPEKVIVLSRDEAKQHDMRMSYLHRRVATDEVTYDNFRRRLEFRIGDIRQYADVSWAVRDADVVVNAAALKQVPNCEYFPEQAVLTNCVGPMNIVRAIREHRLPVETVVGISTDKACKPVNVMGMTKAIHERIFIAANVTSPQTRFIAARYGNVMASRGSVIPLFHEQIRQGGPVTLTVPEMTRFLMSLDEAVDCVFAAIREGRRGETYIPRMPATTVLTLAQALIGGRPIPVRVMGIRPGEKMHEVLVSDEESVNTVMRGDYYVIRPMLPELGLGIADEGPTLQGEYNSSLNMLTVEETTRLLERYGLLFGQTRLPDGVELFETRAA